MGSYHAAVCILYYVLLYSLASYLELYSKTVPVHVA
jgi:hypothetical protein